MGRIVIVGYRPKEGRERELEDLMKQHLPVLRKEGLATKRESIIMRSQNSTIVEVFEWKSQKAIEEAHSNKAVQRMWKEYADCCDYVPLTDIEEAGILFSEFEPL